MKTDKTKPNQQKVIETRKKPNPADNFPGPGPGRPKGSKDRLPRDLKLKVLAVADKLDKAGKSLYDEAAKDPKWFYVNFVKPMLPKDVHIDADVIEEVRVKFVNAD